MSEGAAADDGPAREHGDRAGFVGRLRARLATGIPTNPAHPAPPPSTAVPAIGYRNVDADDLIGTFVRSATSVGVTVDTVAGPLPDRDLLRALVEEHGIERAVLTAEPEAEAVGRLLADLGVEVARASPALAEPADLGVTSARALVAATGSVFLHGNDTGSRSVSLLPRVHLCVASADRVVTGTAEVLRTLSGGPEDLPANLVLVTGPSRTGDIEQLITLGVHGPVAVHVVVTNHPCG